MDDRLRQLCQDILDQSPEEKVHVATRALAEAIEGFKRLGCNKEQINNLIVIITKLFVSADGRCSGSEYSLFKAITGIEMSTDDFYDMTNGGLDEDYIKDTVELLRAADHDTRVAVILYGTSMMASDGTLTVKEQNLIDKLMA